MAHMESHAPGAFCWVELATVDAEGAKAFYSELFGWTAHDDPVGPDMVYTMLQLDGRNAGALYGMGPEMKQMGIPSHWLTYVAVESVDESVRRVLELGGKIVREPMDVMDLGRMAVFQDPAGATLAMWQAKEAPGVQVLNEINAFSWAELLTRGTESARDFYTQVFGWNVKTCDPAAEMKYEEWENGGTPIGGLMEIDSGSMGDIPPNWNIYFRVADCDAAEAKAKELGANVCVPATTIPDVGRFSVLQDPQGAVFSIIHLTHEGK